MQSKCNLAGTDFTSLTPKGNSSKSKLHFVKIEKEFFIYCEKLQINWRPQLILYWGVASCTVSWFIRHELCINDLGRGEGLRRAACACVYQCRSIFGGRPLSAPRSLPALKHYLLLPPPSHSCALPDRHLLSTWTTGSRERAYSRFLWAIFPTHSCSHLHTNAHSPPPALSSVACATPVRLTWL